MLKRPSDERPTLEVPPSKRLRQPCDKHPVPEVPPDKRLRRSSSLASVERPKFGVTVSYSAAEVATNRGRLRTSLHRRKGAPTSQTSKPGRYTLQNAGSATSGSSVSTSSTPDLKIIHAGDSGPKCFRIANVPLNWSEDMLIAALRDADPFLESQKPQIFLYPCVDSTQTQTALLNLGTCTEYFQGLISDDFNYLKTSDGTLLVIDSHFYDLTPLNSPEGGIVADVVAVTGFAGHAFGSWRSRKTQLMWLKDFLPTHVKNIRIMTYGYNSSLKKRDAKMSNYRRSFIEQLELARVSDKNRPIIFIAHSLGGILVLQTLVEAERNTHYKSILSSTQKLFFFGTPFHGFRTEELEAVVDAELNGQRHNLLVQMREDSELLDNQQDDLMRIWADFKGDIVTFFETVRTPSVRRLESGDIVRDGPEVQMVKEFSAQLHQLFELKIPVDKNHTDMVKFDSPVDSTYQKVVRYMKECIAPDVPELQFSKDKIELGEFFKALFEIGQDQYTTKIPPLDACQPKYYWIFQNMDFKRWASAKSQILWLSGPSECNLQQVAWHLANLAKNQEVQEMRHLVLYFSCSALTSRDTWSVSNTTVFVHTLLRQIIHELPQDGISIAIIFLNTLIEANNTRPALGKLSRAPDLWKSMPKIRDVLNAASDSHLWVALEQVIRDRNNLRLSIIVDGLEEVETHKDKFIGGIRVFIERLHGKVKALFTSRPEDDIKASLKGILSIEYDKERKECLNSLRFDNSPFGKISKEHEGSLKWLWTHKEYQKWLSDRSHLLYISGKPGSGKSTLMKYIRNNLFEREPNARSATIASFFYSYREGETQTNHFNMLRSILYDILKQNESFFYHFQPEFRKYHALGLGQFDYESLKTILRSIGKHQAKERLYLLIDAMDESSNEDRWDILQLLFELSSGSNNHNRCIIKVLVASRPANELDLFRKSQAVITMQDVNKSDIESFVHSFLGPELELPQNALHQVKQYIFEHAQGVFQWVYLVRHKLAKYVEKGYSRREIFSFLQCLPTDLEGLYQRILEDLETNGDDGDVAIGKRIFQLILFACRPLTVPELQHALAITDCGGTDTFITPSDEFFQDSVIVGIEKRIVHCGRNFLEVKGQKFKGEPIVQVMHQTVRDFFLRRNGSVANSRFGMSEDDAHRMISTICIRYLVFCAQHPRVATNTTSRGDESELPPVESWTPNNFATYIQYLHKRPLINYALEYLQAHICRCPEAMNSNISLISELKELPAGNPARYVFGYWVADHLNQVLLDSLQREAASKFRNNILWIAAGTGYYQVADALLTAGAQIDIRLQGKTPLELSAENGHETTVQRLLARGAGIETPDSDQCTALHRAAMNGHDVTVRLLLDGGSKIEARDSDYCTALHKAAQNGHEAAIKLLIDRGAPIHAQDSDQCQALHSAAMNGHEDSVRLLLDHHANIQNTGYDRWTALHRATENGQVTTAQLLIDRGALIDVQDSSGCTALHCAAKNGYRATVQLLLDCGAHIEAQNFERCTALHLAAKNGHKDTVRMLLDCGADIQAQPIHHEVASDHINTEKALPRIKKFIEDFDANFQGKQSPSYQPFGLVLDRHIGIAWPSHSSDIFCDSIGMSALHWAAANGHEATVRLLLDCGAHIGAQNSRGWTALHWAAKSGREATVRLLLERGAHAGAQDINGWTALHRAAERGRMAIVQLLREWSQ